MNTKYFVPFESAKQLKEKGLSQYRDMFYNEFGRLCDWSNIGNIDKMLGHFYAAPTYHEVVDWLEEKGMCIICYAPTIRQPNRRYKASVFIDNTIDWRICNTTYPTREEALNAAILKALEMI